MTTLRSLLFGALGSVPLDGPLAREGSKLLKRVKFEPLEIAVGAKTPFKAIHCSDSHFNFMGVSDLIGAHSARNLDQYEWRRQQGNPLAPFAACILKAKLLKVPLLHTGDAWDYDSTLNMELAKKAFETAGDVFYAMGNHEMRGWWEESPDYTPAAWRRRVQPYLPNDVLFASRVINGVDFVAFDDTGYNRDVEPEMMAKVRAEFAKGMPVVVMVHEPFLTPELKDDLVGAKGPFKGKKPVKPNGLSSHAYGARKHERVFIDWLVAQPNLKAVLCGHVHVSCRYALSDRVTQYVVGTARDGLAYEITFT